MSTNASTLDYYKLLAQDDLMEMMREESNRFDLEVPHWTVITKQGLQRVFAVVMLMGIIRKPL